MPFCPPPFLTESQSNVRRARLPVTITDRLAACTRTTITMRSSSGTTRKRAISDPDASDVRGSDKKKAKNTVVDCGHPTLRAQPHWHNRLVSSLFWHWQMI